jgi:hypothetical protein
MSIKKRATKIGNSLGHKTNREPYTINYDKTYRLVCQYLIQKKFQKILAWDHFFPRTPQRVINKSETHRPKGRRFPGRYFLLYCAP